MFSGGTPVLRNWCISVSHLSSSATVASVADSVVIRNNELILYAVPYFSGFESAQVVRYRMLHPGSVENVEFEFL